MLGISTRSLLTVTAAGLATVALARHALRRRRRIDVRDRVVVVTGGSRGLGLLIAEELGRRGARVAICGRDEDALARAARRLEAFGVEVHAAACDLGEREEAEAFIEGVARRFGRIDVLVNNAGIIQVAPLEDIGVEGLEEAMRANFWSAAYVTMRALPHLAARGRGARVVNITSIGGRVAVPHLLGYTASKFAMVGFSEGLRAELARTGVRVTTVVPGPMRTGSIYNAMFGGDAGRELAWFGAFASIPVATIGAQRAARRVVEAALDGRREVRLGLAAHAATLGRALAPGLMARALAAAARLLPPPRGQRADRRGREIGARLQRSPLLRLTNRAARRNNEAPPAPAAR
ncbi:MAG: SDR family NAD(P)-dependent oxidoreductase [Polyangiaceae bacterium]|nr:SDR family NAD(P)-dependent oxidoreductase [Polyangiaceae bacterium]